MFPCVSWQSVYLLWKNAYLDFLPIFDCIVCFLILSYMSCLCIYILKINPMLVSSIANVFHSVYCLFVLFMISFAVQKFLSLIRSYLFIFVFIFIILGGESKKILLRFFSESVLPMFMSKKKLLLYAGLSLTSLEQYVSIF